MNKLKMETQDITANNIEKIGKLFPYVITETKDKEGKVKKAVDFDLLKQTLSDILVEDDNERYRLDWPGKKASLLKANLPVTKTLRPAVEESVDFEKTENLYLEGDNFEVLKILQESYLGKVKMIYIDPPYNTGNDFIYKDNYKKSKDEYEEEIGTETEEGEKLFRNTDSNGRFHSDWLSMMYERLMVARDLLNENGVIFVSIDDNEIKNLRKICDEVFGEENFIADLVWKKRVSPANDSQWYSSDHEYICVYAKQKGSWNPKRTKRTEEHDKYYKNPDNDPRGPWNSAAYTCNKSKSERPNLYYTILNPNTGEKIWPDENAVWAYSKETHLKHVEQGILYWGNNGKAKSPRKKQYLTEAKLVVPRSVWDYQEVGSTQTATTESRNLFNGASFSYPKSVKMLIKAIYQATELNDIIIDFFAGSATTAHATMQLNAEDGGNRKFIMVQLPEKTDENSEAYKAGYKTIAEIGKERIRRAGKKIKEEFTEKYKTEFEQVNKKIEETGFIADEELEEKKKELEEKIEHIKKLDTGFRVYKTDSSNMKDVFYHPAELKQEQLSFLESNIKENRTPEDLLTQVILDLGLELSLKIEKKNILGNTVFIVQENALAACFDDNIDFGIVDEIADLKPFKVVFKDASFKDDKDRINVEERFKRLSPETVISVI